MQLRTGIEKQLSLAADLGVVRRGLPRLVEMIVAGFALVIASPLILLASIGIVIGSGFPVFFRQQRVGKDGRLFTMFKLRTMRRNNAGVRVTSSGDARITSIGRILRNTKLDELPELWNVVKGDLSLVGPRPEVPDYVDLSHKQWKRVLTARPGLTDPVTLRLRNEESLLEQAGMDSERFYLNVLQPYKLRGYAEYLERRSWISDLDVLVKTAVAIVLPGRAPVPTLEEVMGPKSFRAAGGHKE